MKIVNLLKETINEKLVGKFIKLKVENLQDEKWFKVNSVDVAIRDETVVIITQCENIAKWKQTITIYPTAEFEIADEVPQFTFNDKVATIIKRLTQYDWADVTFGKFTTYWTTKLKQAKNYGDVAALMLMPLDDEALTGKMPPLIELLATVYYSAKVTNGFMRDEDVTLNMAEELAAEVITNMIGTLASERAVNYVINRLIGG